MKKILVILMLLLSACSSKDGSAPASKDLFSSWAAGSTTLNLAGLNFGVNSITMVTSPNTGCYCTLEITGDQSQGDAYLSGCTHYGPANFCEPGASAFTYVNVNATLTLCETGSSCTTYR